MTLQDFDRAVATSLMSLNRKRFFRRAGAAGFAAAFLATTWRPGVASADHCLVNKGPWMPDRICGPSPYCSTTRCYTSGSCHSTCSTRPRAYGGSQCFTSQPNHENCWCVCSVNGNKYNCCDCCADTYQGGIAYCCDGGGCPGGSCGSNPGACNGAFWYKCICKGLVCSNCC